MRPKLRVVTAAISLTLVAVLAVVASGVALPRQGRNRARFQFALIGDLPYNATQETQYDNLIDEINDTRVSFTIHDGDIKSGSQRCDDVVYRRERARFDSFEAPAIYTPGDNEWTDCHRASNGAYDPPERLAFLREVFFSSPGSSFGQKELALEYQSAEYPENARWHFGRATFATLHVVGSNNNRPAPRNPVGNEAEYQARNAANIAWLRETFDDAVAADSVGVLLAIQANMFEENVADPSGFDEFVGALREEVIAFGRPVVLVHGDSHYFRIDKPLYDAEGRRLENFTRVETFGSPDVHWLRGGVDAHDAEVFNFEQEIVEANS